MWRAFFDLMKVCFEPDIHATAAARRKSALVFSLAKPVISKRFNNGTGSHIASITLCDPLQLTLQPPQLLNSALNISQVQRRDTVRIAAWFFWVLAKVQKPHNVLYGKSQNARMANKG